MIVSFTESPRSVSSRGGRHVEFGLGLAWNKIVVVVGPRENVFHCLSDVYQFDDWDTFKAQFGVGEMNG